MSGSTFPIGKKPIGKKPIGKKPTGKKITGFCENCRKHPFITIIIPLLIFLIAFIPRIIDLGTGFTIDERNWLLRGPRFFQAVLQGNFIQTYVSYHPGVTTMWLSGLFTGFFSRPGMDFFQTLSIARFPIALVTSLGILLMYFLLKELFHEKIAILASVLIALDPYYLAHSRFIHTDALVTTFMIISLLSFLLYIRKPEKIFFLTITGGFLGLAILTKQPAICLIPFFLVSLIILYLITSYQTTPDLKKTITGCFSAAFLNRTLKPFLIILGIAGLVFVLLWPAMWVAPVGTVQSLMKGLDYVVENPHENTGFFMGQIMTTDQLGPLFYPVVILMKVTPLTLIFSVFCIVFVFYLFRNTKFSSLNLTIILFVLFTLLFYVLMTISEKKMDRYILPVLPVIDILAALGLCFCASLITGQLGKIHKNLSEVLTSNKDRFFGIAIILIVLIQVALLAPIVPYFLSYSNPVVLGGPQHSQEYILIGWGEGNDLAAAYMNNKTGAENLTVYQQYPCFSYYFKGKTANGKNWTSTDYIVFYSSQIQRNINEDVWDLYKNKTPEKVIVINNIEYCWIYPTHPQ